MYQEAGDDLLKLFEKLNIETGNLNPNVIKAWFDTDNEDMLKWICSSITEENYISAQENFEFAQIENVLKDNELEKEVETIEAQYPSLFDYSKNLEEIELLRENIEILENELNSYQKQIQINQNLNHNLSKELSTLTDEEIKSRIEKSNSQEECFKLCSKLDEINSKSYDQVAKYHIYLNHFGLTEVAHFINNVDITGFEDSFNDIERYINLIITTNNDVINVSNDEESANVLSELKNRLFHSKIKSLALQMECDGMSNTLKFLSDYDINAFSSLNVNFSKDTQLNIELNKNQQECMLQIIEKSIFKEVECYINQVKLKYSKSELNFCKAKLIDVNTIEQWFSKMLSHVAVLYNLFLQEKLDINSSIDFFKNIIQYVQKDLNNSIIRREAMLKIIENYRDFQAKPVTCKIKLLENFGHFLSKNDCSLPESLKEVRSVRNEIQTLEEKYFGNIKENFEIFDNLLKNIEIMEKFLTCGPTCRIVTIPQQLQLVLQEVDLNLANQDSSIKSATKIFQNSKDLLPTKKWDNHRRLLWVYFITDSKKMFSLLEELKEEAKSVQKREIW